MAPRTRTVPRKLPRQERSRAMVDAILTAAARVLTREGFDRASTNRIAEAAGVSVGSLYQYFPSKEALVAALAERHVEAMSRELVAALTRLGPLSLRPATREVVRMMLRAHAVDPALHRVLIEQVPRVGRLDQLAAVERHAVALVRGWLAAHRDEVRPRDLDRAAWVTVTAVEALTHAAVLSRPEALADPSLEDEIVELVARYLENS
jgi:AcrR family transcriptional regulator